MFIFLFFIFFLMIRRPPRSTLTDTLFPYTTLFRSFPLLAFSHCRDVVVAVSKAGGMGVFGAAALPPERLEEELAWIDDHIGPPRSEEHTSELQSLMRLSYAVFCLKKKQKNTQVSTEISTNDNIITRYSTKLRN